MHLTKKGIEAMIDLDGKVWSALVWWLMYFQHYDMFYWILITSFKCSSLLHQCAQRDFIPTQDLLEVIKKQLNISHTTYGKITLKWTNV